jgi:putative endonuclease
VYLLRCADGTLYAGATNDLARRLEAHGRGKGARYTRARLPVELAWTASAKDRSAALRREAALKRLSRTEKLALVERQGGRRSLQARAAGARRSRTPPDGATPAARGRAGNASRIARAGPRGPASPARTRARRRESSE